MPEQNWERVEASDVRVGDKIAKSRNEQPAEVLDVGPVSAKARWLHFRSGRIRPRHETKFWRLIAEAPAEELAEEPAAPASSSSPAAPRLPGHPGFSPEVQDALHSAGMSRNSELTPEQLSRAEELAAGKVNINREDPRRAFILHGERSTAMTTDKDGKRTRRNSDTQKGLEAALAVLKASRKPLTRMEIHEGAKKKGVDLGLKPSGSPKIGGVVNEAKAAGIEVDGYRFTNPERGKYSVEKVKGAKPAATKSAAKKPAAKKTAAKAGKGGAKKKS